MVSSPNTPLITPIPNRQHAYPPAGDTVNGLKIPSRRDSRTFDTADLSYRLQTATTIVEEGEEEWSGGNLGYRKGEGEIPLEARIERIFYINLYGQVRHQRSSS